MFQKQLRKQFPGTRLQPTEILLVPGALSSPAQEGEGEMVDAGCCEHDKDGEEKLKMVMWDSSGLPVPQQCPEQPHPTLLGGSVGHSRPLRTGKYCDSLSASGYLGAADGKEPHRR